MQMLVIPQSCFKDDRNRLKMTTEPWKHTRCDGGLLKRARDPASSLSPRWSQVVDDDAE